VDHRDMISNEQIDGIIQRIVDRQKEKDPFRVGLMRTDKNWFLRLGVGHAIGVLVLVAATLFGFGWSMNNRMTAVEIKADMNQQVTHENIADVKKDVGDIKKDVQDVKRDVQNLSSRLASTRQIPESK
jgi:hypothetical protein